MTWEGQYLILAKSVLKDCPEFLSERMVAALVKAGVNLPGDVRANIVIVEVTGAGNIGLSATAPLEINANNRALWEGALRRGHRPALYALEMSQGWFAQRGNRAGAKLGGLEQLAGAPR